MRRWERLAGTALSALLLLTAGAMDPAQRVYRHNRAGIRALGSGDPDTALKEFTEAQAEAAEDPRLLYNLGLALAGKGEAEKARQLWRRAAQLAEGELRRDAWYNHGLSALSGGDAGTAAGSFGEALLVDPTDEQARRNLALALKQLAQQKPQQKATREPDQNRPDSQRSEQRSEAGSRNPEEGSDPQRRQQQGSGEQPPEQKTSGEKEGSEPREDATQRREERQQGSPDGESRVGQDRQPAASANSEERSEGADREMAARLLKMLEQGEKQALRRALRREPDPHGSKQEKDW